MLAYPRCEGGGSVDLELCLPIDSINTLGKDQEFMVAFYKKLFWF